MHKATKQRTQETNQTNQKTNQTKQEKQNRRQGKRQQKGNKTTKQMNKSITSLLSTSGECQESRSRSCAKLRALVPECICSRRIQCLSFSREGRWEPGRTKRGRGRDSGTRWEGTDTTLMASNRGNWISGENPQEQNDHAPTVNPITLVERVQNPTQGQRPLVPREKGESGNAGF